MSFKFENLIIWQKAMDFGEEVNKLADQLPKKKSITFRRKYHVLLIQ
jgi:23S rRNA-intervening sequence protein